MTPGGGDDTPARKRLVGGGWMVKSFTGSGATSGKLIGPANRLLFPGQRIGRNGVAELLT